MRCLLGTGILVIVLTDAFSVAQYHPEKDTGVTAVNERPDANWRMQMRRTRMQTERFALANAERKRQLSADSTRLLQLAGELNAEYEKAGDINAVLTTKAEMIEKLAHSVQEKMKATMGAP